MENSTDEPLLPKNSVSISMYELSQTKKTNSLRRVSSPENNCQLGRRGNPLVNLIFEEIDSFSTATQGFLSNIEKIDDFNPAWYCWEPLHYAASKANPTELSNICGLLGREKINTLTTLSENALHILLDHGRQAESFNISCQNGTDLKMTKLIHEEKENLTECVEILIKAGIDVNHNNFWNETPLLVAIKRKYFGIVRLLLQVKGVDLDTHKSAVSKKTARELLKGKEEVVGPLPKSVGSTNPGKELFQLLKSGDEESFMRYNGGNIKLYANAIDGDSEDNSSCTLLQYCFRRGLILCQQDLKKYEYEAKFHYSDITANPLVQVFCQNGMVKCIEYLLDKGAKNDFPIRKFNESLLEVATIKGYYPLVSMILGRKQVDLTTAKICTVLLTLMENHQTDIDLDSTLSVVLSRVLDSNDLSVGTEESEILMNVLNLGVKRIHKENLKLLLKCPGSLSTKKESTNSTILEEIDPEVIQTHLDECVEQELGEIRINYDSFIKDNSTKLVENIFLKSSTLKVFLNHLVFKILTNRKWERLRLHNKIKYFYLNFWFYVFFYAFLNFYILAVFNELPTSCTLVLLVLNSICWLILFVREVLQFAANMKLYVKDPNNYAEMFLIIITIVVYVTSNEIAMVLAILGVNLVLLLLLEQVPKVAKYIIILRTVVFYLVYLGIYSFIFLAFAICFYILFSTPNQTIWSEVPNRLFDTIILFTGSLDALKDYMGTAKFKENELFSKLVFVIFVFFMAVILHNLLLGLLVNEMDELHRSAKLFEQMKRTRFVVSLESILDSRVGSCLPKAPSQPLFDKNENKKYLIVNETDREMLDEKERQHLDFILVKKVKKQNVLDKLNGYIRTSVYYQPETGKDLHRSDRKLMEKLQLIEERIKNLHDQCFRNVEK